MNGVQIHPTAIVHPNAVLGEGTKIGAYSIVDENVVTGRDCNIQEHVILRGHVTLGEGVQVFPFAVIGGEPQHTRYKGEPTRVEIGDRTILRESVTVHRGTMLDQGVTRVGSDCYLMAYTHIAHDCRIGKNVYLANACQIAGHVEIQDNVILGGQTGVPQFGRVGRYCYIGGGTILRKDIPPFLTGKGNPFEAQGINAVGLQRQGFSEQTISRLRKLYRIVFIRKGLTLTQALEQAVQELGEHDDVKVFADFVNESKLGIHR